MTLTPALIRHLSNPDLFGDLTSIRSLAKPLGKETFKVFNPSTANFWRNSPIWAWRKTKEAIDKAYVTQAEWAAMTARARSDVLCAGTS